jgi:glutathione peroxidase
MNLPETEIRLNTGAATTFGALAGKVTLVVNVASKCGLTPQYEALEALYQKYRERGLVILGVPSNTFLQELSNDEAISEFCKLNYGVTFPLTEKTAVNGARRHDLYKALTKAKDELGLAGPVMWNFEKFLVLPNGEVKRFRPTTLPDDPKIVAELEKHLAP